MLTTLQALDLSNSELLADDAQPRRAERAQDDLPGRTATAIDRLVVRIGTVAAADRRRTSDRHENCWAHRRRRRASRICCGS